MSNNTLQRTPEWRQARVGKITGSRIGAVLGVSPFITRRRVMREMAEEMLGEITEIDGPAMRWGRENEETALKLYEFLIAGDLPMEEVGFLEKGDVGASPDALVGDEGMVEVKCPYGIREDAHPSFKSVFELDYRHYMHQVQMQMYCADREWCDFFQWTPNGYRCERVYRDPDWFGRVKDEIVVYLSELADLVEKMRAGGAEERVAMSARWAAASEAFKLAAAEKRDAEARMEAAKTDMIDLMEAANVDRVHGAGVLMQRTVRTGSVDYKALANALVGEDTVKETQDEYRRSDSLVWSCKEKEEDE